MERKQNILSLKIKQRKKKLSLILISSIVFIIALSVCCVLWEQNQPHKLYGKVTAVSWDRIDGIPDADRSIAVNGQEIKIWQWPGGSAFEEKWSYYPTNPTIKVGDYVTVTYVDPPRLGDGFNSNGDIVLFIRPKSLNCQQCSVVVNKH